MFFPAHLYKNPRIGRNIHTKLYTEILEYSKIVFLHLVPRFSHLLHGVEYLGLRLPVTLALPLFLRLLGFLTASQPHEAPGVVRRRDDAEALVGLVQEADGVEEDGSGAGAFEAVDPGGLERLQLVGDLHC
jgi:hypothetical protein